MNALRQHQGGEHHPARHDRPLLWLGHDELPDGDGRWIYAADRAALARGEDLGVWVNADLDPDLAALSACQALGRMTARADLIVIDQLGIVDEDGQAVMVDEDHLARPGGTR